ncbi:MAG: co-chaperone GroES [Candidatus Vogelbacteria bacterium]|nr:co-chaperone GroES [Candidatus Vogelbacteria bacterium]
MKEKIEKTNIKPLGDRVLVEPILEDASGKSKHGIIIPETVSKEKAEQGLVLAVGAGRLTDQGKLLPLRVKKGQKIIFAKYGPDEIKVGDKEYYIISESSILAVIE